MWLRSLITTVQALVHDDVTGATWRHQYSGYSGLIYMQWENKYRVCACNPQVNGYSCSFGHSCKRNASKLKCLMNFFLLVLECAASWKHVIRKENPLRTEWTAPFKNTGTLVCIRVCLKASSYIMQLCTLRENHLMNAYPPIFMQCFTRPCRHVSFGSCQLLCNNNPVKNSLSSFYFPKQAFTSVVKVIGPSLLSLHGALNMCCMMLTLTV